MASGRILILRWMDSAYDSLGGLLDLMGQEFAAEGYQVGIFIAGAQDWPNQLVEVLRQGGFAFALTMSGIGSDLYLEGGRLIWEAANIPLFNWNCDHACYFPTRHAIRNRFLLHGYIYADHARYNVQHLNANGAAFAVHIGIPARSAFPGAPLPLAQRNGRLSFTKSGRDTNAIEAQWRAQPPIMQQILFPAAEALFGCSTGDFLPTLQRIAAGAGLLLDGSNNLTMMLLRELDAYIRYRRGNLLMHAVLRYPVDVGGSGWEHIPWDGARAEYHGVGDWASTLRQLPQYTGRLSFDPLIQDSFHDRVFVALAAGVPPITDANAFTRARAPALEPYTFEFTPRSIEAAIDALLSDPADAIARTEATFEAMQPEFSMRASARQIAEFVTYHVMNAHSGA